MSHNLREHFKLFALDSASENEKQEILNNCISLFKKDYKVNIIENENLCPSYPKKLIIVQDSINTNISDSLGEMFEGSCNARLRSRFPVPVISYNGKNICRSSTLAQKAECVAKAASNSFSIQGALSWFSGETNNSADDVLESSRNGDIALIKALKIRYICDLMVEDKKKKFGIYVSSSEKTDRLARYAGFCITAIPYPGTEFFSLWKDHDYSLTEVDWDQFGTDTTSVVLDPDAPRPFQTNDWKSWNILELTNNYLRLILTYLATGDCGILVHCISGWDRTPLYISLIRMSLWADGLIHQSLSALEILYLTVNYDWFLFHHYLKDRCARGEDIFYFCFHYLSQITGDTFSMDTITKDAEQQIHSVSQKISIRPSDEETDDIGCGSFGSCGRSWEMTSGYMNHYGKSLKNGSTCLFIDENSLPQGLSDNSGTENSQSFKEGTGDGSEDAMFSFDDGEEEFHVLSRSSCDDLPDDPPVSSENQTNRARKLLEVQRIMQELYSSYVAGTL